MGRDNCLVGRMVPLQAIIGTLYGHLYNMYNKSSAIVQMGDRLVTIDMGRKLGDVPLLGGRVPI